MPSASRGGTWRVVSRPNSAAAHAAIDCLVRLQREAGGNALIGREVYPLLMQADLFDAGVRDLYRTTEPDGVFCYTFLKGVGTKPRTT